MSNRRKHTRRKKKTASSLLESDESTKAQYPVSPLAESVFKPGKPMRALPKLPAGIMRFEFGYEDGIGQLTKESNGTATVIHHDGPALCLEITQAATFCQQLHKKRGAIPSDSVQIIRSKYPAINHYCDDERILRVICSDAGDINPRHEAVEAIVERTQVNKSTVERAFRKNPTKQTAPHTPR